VSDTMDQVVWTRSFDRARQQRRSRLFRLYYALPLAVIVVVTAVAADPWSALGVLILGGGFGLLLGGWVFMTNRNERANGEIVLRAGTLVCGRTQVPMAQVVSFTTFASTTSVINPAAGSSATSDIDMGNAVFQLNDGNSVSFAWPSMPADHVDGVRIALEGVLPGRWQPQQL
jgi:hypothetical protein